MPSPTQKARIGGFVVLGITLFVCALVLTVGFSSEPRTSYRMVFNESVDGLSVGSGVKYRGLPIGQVTDMRLEDVGNGIIVEIEVVNRIASLYEGSVARLRTSGVVGNTFIQIEGGSPNAGVMVAGATIETIPSLSTQLQTDLPAIVSDLRNIMSDLNKSIQTMDLQDIISESRATVVSVRETVDMTRGELPAAIQKINAAADSVTSAAATVSGAAVSVDKIVQDIDEPLVKAVGEASETLKSVDKTLNRAVDDLRLQELRDELQETIRRLNRLLYSVDTAARNVDVQIEDVVGEVNETLYQIQILLDDLERDPASLIFGADAAPESE